MTSILVVFHTPSNEGYAMSALERTFFDVAFAICRDRAKIHFSFTDYSRGRPISLPSDFSNYIEIDYKRPNLDIVEYIKKNRIDCVFAFDLSVQSKLNRLFRLGGVKYIISYWGSEMSSIQPPGKLLLKKLEVAFRRYKPDCFIFESEAMRELAVKGRGVNKKYTYVIPTGVDTDKFTPLIRDKKYLKDKFGIAESSFVVVYSGHMEERKGVDVIMKAAIHLHAEDPDSNIVFLVCGNRDGEEYQYLQQIKDTKASEHVVFAGYRKDIPEIMASSDVGVIASTGWDSFPMSSLEMASSGLPVLASNLQGLSETIQDGVTGFLFNPGDHVELAKLISHLTTNPALYKEMSHSARKRIEAEFSFQRQRSRLAQLIANIIGDK